MSKDYLKIKGAKEHNLKNISVDIPKNEFVVITGLSGSGKSSLAFDTIYAEGQRRYVESLSAYARQFLGQMEKPNVESIEGLSPAIAIDQKTSSRSPRSTVGTVTEVHDYLRLLWARIGISFCPICGTKIEKQSVDFIVKQVLNIGSEINIEILAPVVQSRKGEFENLFKDLLKDGFSRAYIDGQLTRLDEAKRLDRYFNHDISVVVDRLKIKKTGGRRLPQSIEAALKLTDGIVDIKIDDEIKSFSQNLGCKECGTSYGELEPRDFSFNSPFGACDFCNGLGVNYEIDENLLLKDRTLTIKENVFPEMSFRKYFRAQIHGVCEYFEIPMDIPYEEISINDQEILLYGTDGIKTPINYTNRFGNKRSWKREFPGVIPLFKKIYEETSSDKRRDYYMQFMRELDCGECDGERLKKIENSINEIKKEPRILRSINSEVGLETIISVGLFETDNFTSKKNIQNVEEDSSDHSSHSHDHSSHSHDLNNIEGFTSISFKTSEPFSLRKFQYFLDNQISENVFRAKGILWFMESERKHIFHLSGKRFSLDDDEWTNEKSNKIVLIGKDLDHQTIKNQLDLCRFNSQQNT